MRKASNSEGEADMKRTLTMTLAALLVGATLAAAGTGVVAGTVVNDLGSAVEGARVSLWQDLLCVGYVLSDASGAFAVTDVAEGTYTLRAGLKGVGQAQIEGIVVLADQTTNVGVVTLIGRGPR